jgi:metallo-beta-lactamase class B
MRYSTHPEKRHSILQVALVACLVIVSQLRAQGVDPHDRRAVKLLFDSWKLPVPPRHLVGNIYYVGAAGISSFLIVTHDGHFLIDTGFEDSVPQFRKNIELLGYRMADIRFILSSHAHADHVGGHAEMKRLTGATIVASQADGRLLESGGDDDFSPFPKDFMKYAPVRPDQIVEDGDQITLCGVTMIAHLTPGHTKGATTWSTQVYDEDGKRCNVVFFSSVSIVQGTRLVGNAEYPNIVEDYEATFRKLKALPCDIYFAPHGGQFAMSDKFARLDKGEKPSPLIDPQGWKKMIEDGEKAFGDQLATERAQAPRGGGG